MDAVSTTSLSPMLTDQTSHGLLSRLLMDNGDEGLSPNFSGFGEPQSPTGGSGEPQTSTSGLGKPQSPASGCGEPKSPSVSRVPLRPLPGYAKDGVIDTLKLGSLPIGAQYTTCSFCDARAYTDRQVVSKEQSFLAEIGKLETYLEGKLSSFEARVVALENRMSQDGGIREQPEVDTPVDLRADFETLRTQLFGEVRAMRSRVNESSTPGREVALSQAAGASGSSPRGGDSPRVVESYIDTMYRRVVQSEPGVEVAPPAAAEPREVRGGTRATRRRRRRRRKRTAARENEGSQAVEQAPVNLLLGDSLVGRATEGCFTGLSPNNKCHAYPGAGVWRVTGVVGKLPPAPRNTLILSVGGNDFFGRGGRTGEAKPLLQDYNTLLEMARSKTSRCVVVGLVPRKFRSNADYSKARNINRKIEDLCRAKGMRFVDPWTEFFGKDQFFQRDGVHFTNQGSKAFVEMVRKNLYGPPRQRRRKPNGSRTTVTGVTTSTPSQQPEARVAEAGPAPVPTVPRAVSADVSFASVLVATPPPVVRSEAPKRQRSPLQDGSARQSPQQKRRRASEGGTPEQDSSPVERSPPPPSGNESRPE